MKTITEQIAGKCVHFNGVMNDCCKAGVAYADVRVGKPYQFPCLNQGGDCAKRRFRTPEEVEAEEKELMQSLLGVLTVNAKIREHYDKTGEAVGKIPCQCGGELSYHRSDYNGHFGGYCPTCKLSFQE